MKRGIGLEKFVLQMPNEDVCLENLFKVNFTFDRCPKCENHSKYLRVKGRKCFQCNNCLNQIYPMESTIMKNSTTEIRKWLMVMFLMAHSKNGISAKEISSSVDVTYKTAWRMVHKIRELMSNDNLGVLSGIIEIDETFVGGRLRNKERSKNFNPFTNKMVILGMYQRGGKIKTRLVENTSKESLLPVILDKIKNGATVYSDENGTYKNLPSLGYHHDFITHKKKEWGRGEVTTNRIEGVWSNLKNIIRGTYRHFKPKYAENYLREHEFRLNNRKETNLERFLKLSRFAGFELEKFYLEPYIRPLYPTLR